ncbi:MAG: SUMF1/EgtB/PvdO family nonheme iron enzyme [Kiritimatiellia bacterium]
MTSRSLPLLLFPMLGGLIAWVFRPSEPAWSLDTPEYVRAPERKILNLPDGSALRFIRVRGTDDIPDFFLSETEVPAALWSAFSDQQPSHALALEFCEWLSRQTTQHLRLPRAEEWRLAARAGVPNAEFPWGFGPPIPPKGLRFNLPAPPSKPGPAFGYGFRDLAGGRWEWTQERLALGSAWSERDPNTLYIDHQWHPPPDYAGKDIGLRLVWE